MKRRTLSKDGEILYNGKKYVFLYSRYLYGKNSNNSFSRDTNIDIILKDYKNKKIPVEETGQFGLLFGFGLYMIPKEFLLELKILDINYYDYINNKRLASRASKYYKVL